MPQALSTINTILLRRPWVWLRRIRHRRGYGIHSPFAYAFVRGVLLEPTPYYSYAPLSRMHTWPVRMLGLYPLTCRRLLFRLANYAHPHTYAIAGECPVERAYIRAAVPSATEVEAGTGSVQLLFVGHSHAAAAREACRHMPADGMLIMEGIHHSEAARRTWQDIVDDTHATFTFDLYTYGIALFRPAHHMHRYTISF